MSIQPSHFIVECPLCRATYEQTGVRLLREFGGTRLFHCSCQSCGRSMLALMLESSGWLSTVGLVTDLEIADALRLEQAEAITSDECIRLHRMIDQDSRAFCRYLQENKSKIS